MKLPILVVAAFVSAFAGRGMAQSPPDPPLLGDDPGRDLTEKLERNEGVITPPAVDSPIVVSPPPTSGDMPVIKPPAPPQPPQASPDATKPKGDAAGS